MRIQRNDLVNQVYDRLKENIINGNLAPHTPLRQEDLADSLGVSRQPISHALVLLEREGLITDLGRKSKMVTPVAPQQLLNLYQVRAELDGLAASLCAVNVSSVLENRLETVLQAGRDAAEVGSVDALLKADIAFHRTLYEFSGNPEIARMADNSWSHVVRAMHQVLKEQQIHRPIWDDHMQIAAAILRGDGANASELARSHANSSGELTFQRLNRLEEQ